MNQIIEEDIDRIVNVIPNLERLRGKSILITGASGFLPAYMVETLCAVAGIKGITPAEVATSSRAATLMVLEKLRLS